MTVMGVEYLLVHLEFSDFEGTCWVFLFVFFLNQTKNNPLTYFKYLDFKNIQALGKTEINVCMYLRPSMKSSCLLSADLVFVF